LLKKNPHKKKNTGPAWLTFATEIKIRQTAHQRVQREVARRTAQRPTLARLCGLSSLRVNPRVCSHVLTFRCRQDVAFNAEGSSKMTSVLLDRKLVFNCYTIAKQAIFTHHPMGDQGIFDRALKHNPRNEVSSSSSSSIITEPSPNSQSKRC
jgi:hypothetical protein